MRVHQLSINSLCAARLLQIPTGRCGEIANLQPSHLSFWLVFWNLTEWLPPIYPSFHFSSLCAILEYFLAVCPPDAESLLRIARAYAYAQMKAAVIFCAGKTHHSARVLRFDSFGNTDCCQTFWRAHCRSKINRICCDDLWHMHMRELYFAMCPGLFYAKLFLRGNLHFATSKK
jgi:hypothetical protein